MRDRETDSWWSIMTSSAIGGELEGAELEELPLGEKTTWNDWVDRHPHTVVLSVNGREHVQHNSYESYFASDETFRGLRVDDQRLPAKEPVFSFWLEGQPYAIAHQAVEGGRLLEIGDVRLFLYREPGAHLFASTRSFRWNAGAADATGDAQQLLAAAERGDPGIEPFPGLDTFWYTWVSVNRQSRLLH